MGFKLGWKLKSRRLPSVQLLVDSDESQIFVFATRLDGTTHMVSFV